MYFQRINRDDPEKVFINVQSVYTTASLAAGDIVCFDVATYDGVRVTNPLTANLHLVCGAAAETIANGGFGLVQAWGFRNDIDVDGTSGGNAGDVLKHANASFDLLKYTTAQLVTAHPYFVAGTSFSTGTSDRAVFLRCI